MCTELIAFTVFWTLAEHGPPEPLTPRAQFFPGSPTRASPKGTRDKNTMRSWSGHTSDPKRKRCAETLGGINKEFNGRF